MLPMVALLADKNLHHFAVERGVNATVFLYEFVVAFTALLG